jgi:hypothetical protein
MRRKFAFFTSCRSVSDLLDLRRLIAMIGVRLAGSQRNAIVAAHS